MRIVLSGDDFDGVLLISRSYRYGATAPEAVEKIATEKKYYHKCSLHVITCIATTYQ